MVCVSILLHVPSMSAEELLDVLWIGGSRVMISGLVVVVCC